MKTDNDRATSFTVCDNKVAIDKVNQVALDWVKPNNRTICRFPK